MRAVWTVIRREYLQRVRSKWFIFSTIGVPVFFAAAMGIPIWLAAGDADTQNRVVVLDRTGVLFEGVAGALGEGGLTVEGVPSSTGEDELRRRVAAGDIGGYLVLDDRTLASGAARFVGEEAPSTIRRFSYRQAVAQSVLEARLGDDADVGSLIRGGSLDVETTDEAGGGMDDPAFLVAYTGSFVLYMVVLLYAVAVMRSVLEEKTSRIVEVIVSSIRPWQLMLGKILGVGAVGLTQIAVWAGVVVLTATLGLPGLLAARPELAQLSELRDVLPGLGFLALFLVFFLGGYFMYSGLYAAVGAMCNSDEEAQQAQFPVMLLLIVPIVAVVGVIENPAAPWAVALSLFPFFSPILMFARAAAGAAAAWEIALSVVLMVATVFAVAWLAGRIYRVGILMTGKRPTLPELMRWVRQA